MEKETKKFRIITQYIKDLSFENKLAINKLRNNKPITKLDLEDLEKIFNVDKFIHFF